MSQEAITKLTKLKQSASFSEQFAKKITITALAIFNNNVVGIGLFSFILLVEYIYMAYLLIVTTHPNVEFQEYIETKEIRIFPESTDGQLVFSFNIVIMCLIVSFLMIFLKLLLDPKKNFNNVCESSILVKSFSAFQILMRTLMTYLYASFSASAIYFLLQTSGNSTLYFYLLSVIISLGGVFYLLSLFLTVTILQLPIPHAKITWNSINAKVIYFKELIKFIIIFQPLIGDSLRKNRAGISIYCALMVIIFGLFTLKRMVYFNQFVDKLNKYCLITLLSLSILLLIRTIFLLDFLELLFYYPIVSLVVYKSCEFIEKRSLNILLQKLQQIKSISLQELSMIIQKLEILIQRQNDKDLFILQEIIYHHRRTCSISTCVCNYTYYITLGQFQEHEDAQKNADIKFSEQKMMNGSHMDGNDNTVSQNIEDLNSSFPQIPFLNIPSSGLDLYKATSCIIRSQMLKPQGLNHQSSRILKQESSNQFSNQNLSLHLETDIVISGFQLEELFKHVFNDQSDSENFALIMDPDQVVDDDHIKLKEVKCNNVRQARIILFSKLMSRFMRIIEQNQNVDQSFHNFNNHLYFINYINTTMQKHFLALYHLINIRQVLPEMGILDKVQFQICEHLILKESAKHSRLNEQFDYQSFIEANHQQLHLDQLYSQTTFDIIEFWRKWKSDNPNIPHIMNQGVSISKNIKEIKQLTTQLQESQIIKKDLFKFQVYSFFFLEILHDTVVFTSLLNFIKNSMLKQKNKAYENYDNNKTNNKHQQNVGDIGICIAQQRGNNCANLEFLYTNKQFQKIFSVTEKQAQGQSIHIVIPEAIQPFHDQMIKRLYHDGVPRLLGKMRATFGKDREGFLIPVTIRVNFYHHTELGYTIIGLFEKLKHLNLFQDETNKIPTDDAIFFMTDEDFNVLDISKNILHVTGTTAEQWILQKEMGNGRQIKMSNFIVDFDRQIESEFITNDQFQNEPKGLANKLVKIKKYNKSIQSYDDKHSVPGILTFLQQFYFTQNEVFKINIFIVVPQSKHPDYDTLGFTGARATLANIYNTLNSTCGGKKLNAFVSNQNILGSSNFSEQEQAQEIINDIMSMSSTNSTGSNFSIVQAQYAKNMLFTNRTPKDIKISLVILICMLIAFFIISVYNLSIFIGKHSEIEFRLESYSSIAESKAHTRASCLDIKMLQFIALDTQNLNKTSILPKNMSRIDFYHKNLEFNIEVTKDLIDDLTERIKGKAEYAQLSLEFKDLKFLTDEGYIYEQSVKFTHMVNLFVNYLDSIEIDDIFEQKTFLNISNYAKNYSMQGNLNKSQIINRKLTVLEKQLFFILENGMYRMAEIGQRQVNMLIHTSNEQTDSSLKTLNITTFISIAIVVILGIVIFPMLSRILERQYLVLKFFNYLTPDHIDKFIKKCQLYQKELQEKLGEEIEVLQSDDELAPEATIEQKLKRRKSIKNRTSNTFIKKRLKSVLAANRTQLMEKQKTLREEKKKKNQRRKSRKLNEGIFEKDGDQNISESANEESKDQDESYEHEEQPKQRIDKNRLSISIAPTGRNRMIASQIHKLLFRSKAKIFVFVFFLVIYLNSSLLISFQQSQDVFANDKDGIQQLSKFFVREECTYNLFLFMREQIIRNQTIEFDIYTTGEDFTREKVIPYYVQKCMENENQIYQLRKNIPSYLKDAEQDLNEFESNLVCNKTYLEEDPQKASLCEKAMDKLLDKGIANAVQYFINYIQQQNLKFEAQKQMTYENQMEILSQEKFHESIDFILYFFRDCFDISQGAVREAQINYTTKARFNYILAFGIFMGFTALISVIFGTIMFRRIKKQLLDVQNMLILIPFDELQSNQRQKIENYIIK